MTYTEIIGDLFTANRQKYVFAHCVSTNCAFGSGIAKQFAKRYPGMDRYCSLKKPLIGNVILFENVYNLFTKEMHNFKPTYKTLRLSLETLQIEMIKRGNKFLAIPQIGCGLDKLSWNRVKTIIHEIFEDTDIEIVVYIWDK